MLHTHTHTVRQTRWVFLPPECVCVCVRACVRACAQSVSRARPRSPLGVALNVFTPTSNLSIGVFFPSPDRSIIMTLCEYSALRASGSHKRMIRRSFQMQDSAKDGPFCRTKWKCAPVEKPRWAAPTPACCITRRIIYTARAVRLRVARAGVSPEHFLSSSERWGPEVTPEDRRSSRGEMGGGAGGGVDIMHRCDKLSSS